MRIIAFDFETGGLSPDRHPITQLAVVACEAHGSGTVKVPTLDRSEVGRFVRVWAVRPAPGLMIEDRALEIQGHTRTSLLRRPNQITETDLVKELQEFFGGLPEGFECAPFVAHNGQFDHDFLSALYRRHNIPVPARDALCTIVRQRELVRRKTVAKTENLKLSTLAKSIGLTQDEAHDALQDTKICAALFAWQEHLLASSGNLLDEASAEPVGRVYKHQSSPAVVQSPQKPTSDTKPAPKPFFSVSKQLCELHRKAKSGELEKVEGFSSRSGPVEDTNRFVIGAFRNILSTLEDLEKLAKVQQKKDNVNA